MVFDVASHALIFLPDLRKPRPPPIAVVPDHLTSHRLHLPRFNKRLSLACGAEAKDVAVVSQVLCSKVPEGS